MMDEIKKAFGENKLAIVSSAVIFMVSIILGYVLEPSMYTYLNPVVDDLTQKVQSGVVKLTFVDIFSNNVRVIFQMFIYGLIFCLSALPLAFNGFFCGYYVASCDDLISTLLLIIPHGIFEFSSCILACAGGFVLFNSLFKFLKSLRYRGEYSILQNIRVSFSMGYDKLKQAVVLFLISIILMAIAGFIEVYLTIHIAELILSMLS